MNPLPDTAYVLVGRCLAPSLTDIQKKELARDLARPGVRWEALLAEANRQHATPLWYARLAEHDLLDLLPGELKEYLAQLHAANRARNRMLRDELAMILGLFTAHGIPMIPLKGAATFADGLYADDGARLMSDLDLLVPGGDLQTAERLLMMEGYVDDPKDRRHLDTWPASARHGHIATLLHHQKKVAVELHYNTAYGQAGRILTVDAVRTEAVWGHFRGQAVAWPAPHHRLLHNALHATLPHREFRQGRLRLSDLAEFAALAARYPREIQLDRFWETVHRCRLETEIGTYVLLARLLMRSEIKPRYVRESTWHRDRLLQSSPSALVPAGRFSGLQRRAWQAFSFIDDKLRLPAWTWRNVCYGDDRTPLAARLGCIARLLVVPRMIRNVWGKME